MIGALVAVVMAASFFMPWVDVFGETAGPISLLDGTGPSISEMPWRVWLFLASFVIAGFAAVRAVIGQAAAPFMLIAGAIPFVLIGERALGVGEQVQDLGLPMPGGGDLSSAVDILRDFMAYGLPAYFVAAALLVVIGFGRIFGRR